MGKIKLAVFDLDRTLLNNDHQVSELNQKALQLISKTVPIVLCTGRSAPTIIHIEKQVGIQCKFVTCNGAEVFDFDPIKNEKTLVYHKPVPKDVFQRVLREADAKKEGVNIYKDDYIYAVDQNPEVREMLDRYANITGATYKYVSCYQSILSENSSKLVVMTGFGKSKAKMEYFENIFPTSVARVIPEEFFVEILHPEVNKGSTLKYLCKEINISMDDVVAFGDGYNDVEMIKDVGMGIAMLNGKQEVKDVAYKVSEKTNDEDGVGIELLRMHKEGLF